MGNSSSSNGNNNAMVAAHQTPLSLSNSKDGLELSSVNVEPDGRRVVDMLTSSQLDEKRKGFKLSEDRCQFVNNASQSIGECADYNTEEKKVVGGILADYFPNGYFKAKTERPSKASNPRLKTLEFIRKYGCANANNTGCNCMLYIARVQGAILCFDRVDDTGVPFQHTHDILQKEEPITADAFNKSDESKMSAASLMDDAYAARASLPPTRKNPNPSGSPTGELRRAKNQKRSALSNAGDTSDLLPMKSEEEDLVADGTDVPSITRSTSVGDDVFLLKLFQGEVKPCEITITEGTTFDSPTELFHTTIALFMSGGMLKSNLGKINKGSLEDNGEESPWGGCVFIDPRDGLKSKVPSRGALICKHKNCCWRVPFSYIKEKGHYAIRSGREENRTYRNHLCLVHNHPPDVEDTGVEGYIEIKKRNDLTTEEKDLLMACARLGSGMPRIQYAMSTAFGVKNKRSYDSNLLRREVDRCKKHLFGTDDHRMKEFMEMGSNVKQAGGWFDVDISSGMILIGTRFQTPLMRQLAEQYGSLFCIADGTFGADKYGSVCMPFTTSDCTGKTHCIGITTGRSENSPDAIKAAHAFRLSSVVSVGSSTSEDEDVDVVSVSFCCCTLYEFINHVFSLSITRMQ